MDPTHPVAPPRLVAMAKDNHSEAHAFADSILPSGCAPKYGQDFTFSLGRAAPHLKLPEVALVSSMSNRTFSVGTNEADLKPKMEKLLDIFASDDKTGMAQRLFTEFLKKQSKVKYFEDKDLNAVAAAHDNILYFCAAALGAPSPFGRPPGPGTTRIHQALKAASWDVTKLTAPTDLGAAAFNNGRQSPFTSRNTGDWANGLGLMIDGVQYAYVIATHYDYDKTLNFYCITLKYVFYDVFGLDDTDLQSHGSLSDGKTYFAAGVGITAWWQLQHQFGYAPLVTRIVVEKTYTAPAL